MCLLSVYANEESYKKQIDGRAFLIDDTLSDYTLY